MSGGYRTELDIFEIERFAIHDGIGIRTAVFLQGCPLRCEWCANPESQTVGRNIMLFSNKCSGCGQCSAECQNNAAALSGGHSVIDRSICVSCGKCAKICPNNAIKVSGEKITCERLFDIVRRDIDYYHETNGGITLSGGEALCQIEKLMPFLELCRQAGISTAFETCGHVPVKAFEAAEIYAAQFLFDIKTLNVENFRHHTGGDLGIVMAGFEFLCRKAPEKITVRVPVIPGFNDSEIPDILRFTAEHGIRRLDLLPYHTLGISKYEQLGRKYPYPKCESLEPDTLSPYMRKGEELGLEIKIGG